MCESPRPTPTDDLAQVAATDAAVGIWAFATFAGLLHLIDVILRAARGDTNARLSRVGLVTTSFSVAGLVLRLSSRFRREYALSETVTRLGAAVDDLERVVRTGAQEAVAREERAAAREERLTKMAETTLIVSKWALAIAVLSFVAAIVGVVLSG